MHNFFTALGFLTRIHVKNSKTCTAQEFSASVVYFPWVGIMIGSFLAIAHKLCLYLQLPNFLQGVVLIFWEICLTGTLLLDGFMDTSDGIFSARNRDKMLIIMKDSHVGANAVIALVLLILFKLSFYLAIGEEQLTCALFAMPLVTKVLLVFFINNFSSARPDGLGALFQQSSTIFSNIMATVLSFGGLILLGLPYLLAGIITFVLGWILAKYIASILGGLTGDTYGFLTECSGIIFLASLYFLLRVGAGN